MATEKGATNMFFVIQILLALSNTKAYQPNGETFRSKNEFARCASNQAQEAAAFKLVARVVGHEAAKYFRLHVDEKLVENGKEVGSITTIPASPYINIAGPTGVVVAWTFHHYLKHVCHSHISWTLRRISLPDVLPKVNLTLTMQQKLRYYANTCTHSYSFVWWDWNMWEVHIDWLALNGVNLPLAFSGQEEVWRRVWSKVGLSWSDVQEHISGPAFLAWERMGNMEKFGGPIPLSWIQGQFEMQQKIHQRMLDFGMLPVLPGFAGHVPKSLRRLYPRAAISSLDPWSNFNCSYSCTDFLDPLDPLFHRIGSMFIAEQMRAYGGCVSHFYNSDPFNEMIPVSMSKAHLQQTSRWIFGSMRLADSDAVWVLQGWMFINSDLWTKEAAEWFLTAVPKGAILVLDLQAELSPVYPRLESFFGQPFIWCMLHNFGGVSGLYGAIGNVNQGIFEAVANASSLVGFGLSMEGIFQNYFVYDFALDLLWRSEPVGNLSLWADHYAIRRYGSLVLSQAREATALLANSVYNDQQDDKDHSKMVLVKRPRLNLKPFIWYKTETLIIAWEKLVHAALYSFELVPSTLREDLVDVTRQTLQVLFGEVYLELRDSFRSRDLPKFKATSLILLEILNDLESVLATDQAFLLGPWVTAARMSALKAGSSTADNLSVMTVQDLFEWNAKNQITLWGPDGEIVDYAAKQWSGCIQDYYMPRWLLFFQECIKSLEKGVPFDQQAFNRLVLESVEKPFTFSKKKYPNYARGDPVILAETLHLKYSKLLRTANRQHLALNVEDITSH
ncbi:unnamed protein product [Cyprideis torosa]|uniref:Uncharacterized protein n=1 Tax=Cyprideis torosa TaxID=163714 RepID=A0A7R8W3U0_9CRUS|nr:unnamed protein product [Cyprideis torosa]CAG0881244.1 unnamed protein product [Cyprideis torosa]